jgi:hypothetical protein
MVVIEKNKNLKQTQIVALKKKKNVRKHEIKYYFLFR